MDENQEDLWQRIKAAKDHLFTQTAFLQQYGSGSAHGPDLSPRSRCRSHTMPPVPVTSGPSPLLSSSSAMLSSIDHTQEKQQEKRGLSSKGQSARQKSMKNQWESSSGCPSPQRSESISVSSLPTAGPIARPFSIQKHNLSPSFNTLQGSQGVALETSIVSPLKGKQPAASQEHTQTPDNMSNSDASDEVMLRNGPRFRRNSGKFTNGARPRQIFEQNTYQNHRRRASNPGQHRRTDSKAEVSFQENREPQSSELVPRRISVDEGPSRSKAYVTSKKDPFKAAAPATLDELKQLQKQIVQNAHLNRFKDADESTNPEALAKARDGPGTDPSSEAYRELAKRGAIPGRSKPAQLSTGNHRRRKVLHEAQRAAYAESSAVFPAFEDGRLVLVSEPTADSGLILRSSDQELGLRMDVEEHQPESSDQPAEHNWGDAFYADWEYRPRACSNFEAFRDWFRRWLDTTMSICCYVDIYHLAFFDGTAHPDGEQSLMIPDFDDHSTRLDWNDEETRLHHHETVEGYCYNLALHAKREEEEEQRRRVRARNAYIECTKTTPVVSPQTPKANFYIRPVELGDIPELLEIFNWYIQKSTLAVDFIPLDPGEARQRIETSKRERLPFLVAAERRSVQSRDSSSQKILGYALAADTVGDRTAARFTAELELFVRPEYKRRGIGKSLMDKLLEVCDPTYHSVGGYFFDASWEEKPWYRPGGQRRLARLILIITFPHDDCQQHKWVQDWLEREYDFEQQGLLNGVRIKFDRFLHASYLVRKVGFVDDDTLRN